MAAGMNFKGHFWAKSYDETLISLPLCSVTPEFFPLIGIKLLSSFVTEERVSLCKAASVTH